MLFETKSRTEATAEEKLLGGWLHGSLLLQSMPWYFFYNANLVQKQNKNSPRKNSPDRKAQLHTYLYALDIETDCTRSV